MCVPQALSEGLSIRHFHSEERAFILHSDVLGTEGESEVSQVRKVFESNLHVKSL